MAFPSNPFSAHRVMPGAIPFRFPEGVSAESLAGRFLAGPRLGQILGPHGSGKTTLLRALASELERQGARTFWMSTPRIRFGPIRPGVTVCVDRGERASRAGVRLLAAVSRARGAGLLLTAHRDFGLPVLWRTEVRPEAACRILSGLSDKPGYSEAEAAELLRRHGGNFREVLFEMYDRFEDERAERLTIASLPPLAAKERTV